jgi:hypothetical protein
MVDFLEHGLAHHVAQELQHEGVDMTTCLTRAFLTADIHAKMLGIEYSGATVAICLIRVSPALCCLVNCGFPLSWLSSALSVSSFSP